jgi:hypothetical protein
VATARQLDEPAAVHITPVASLIGWSCCDALQLTPGMEGLNSVALQLTNLNYKFCNHIPRVGYLSQFQALTNLIVLSPCLPRWHRSSQTQWGDSTTNPTVNKARHFHEQWPRGGATFNKSLLCAPCTQSCAAAATPASSDSDMQTCHSGHHRQHRKLAVSSRTPHTSASNIGKR